MRVSDRGVRAKMGVDATVPFDRRADLARAPFLDVALGPGEADDAYDPVPVPGPSGPDPTREDVTRPTDTLAAILPAPAPDEPLTAAGGDAPAATPASPVDLARALDRAAAERRPVAEGGAWVTLDPGARAAAAPGGRPAGPLERTVVAIKDLVAVAGLPSRAGSRTRCGAPPEPRDAAVVARLRAAGAVVAGTVALHELAFGVSGVNDEVGFPPHPHDPARVPGGSSSGSAVAVAQGTADLAVGTDTGGSVRIPAALCGVVGFKPGRGRYPLDGVLPLSPTLDHVGFVARTVAGVAAAHAAVTGEAVPPAGPPAGLRLGVDRAGLAAADAAVAGAVDAALAALAAAGCELVDVDWPDRAEVLDVSTTVMFAEAAAVHRELISGPDAGLLGAAVLDRLRAGAALTVADHRDALAAAGEIEARVRAALAGVDAVVGPTVPIQAPMVEAARTDPALARCLVADTRVANVAGVPALTVPVPVPGSPGPGGGSGSPLPVGLQVTGVAAARTLAVGAVVAGTVADAGPGPDR